MAYLSLTHPVSKLAFDLLAVNHCIALHGVWFDSKHDFFYITLEKGSSQYKLVLKQLDTHIEIRLYDDKDNTQIMRMRKYKQPKDLKKIAYKISTIL